MAHHYVEQYIYCGSPKRRKERAKGIERIFGIIMAENSPNVMKDMTINIYEV